MQNRVQFPSLFLLMSKKIQQTGLEYGLFSLIIKNKRTIVVEYDKS